MENTMNKKQPLRFFKFFIASAATLCLITSCMVKAPTEGTELGSPATSDQILAAITEAQGSVPQEKAYHIGDFGTMQVVDNVMQNNYVVETHEFQISGADENYIYYSEHVVENGSTKQYGIKRKAQSASNSAKPTALNLAQARGASSLKANKQGEAPMVSIKKFLSSLIPLFPAQNAKGIAELLKRQMTRVTLLFKKISIEKSSAVAEEDAFWPSEKDIFHNQLLARLERHQDNLSPSDSPAPSESPAPASTSKYYGLNVSKIKYTTSNCSQIPNCIVNATKILFAEVRKLPSGNTARLNWVYIISNEVPGLFMILDECYSTVVTQNENQYPLTECARVNGFKFGSKSINSAGSP